MSITSNGGERPSNSVAFSILGPILRRGSPSLILDMIVGLESVMIGKLCGKLYVNDLTLFSLELCKEQLDQNRIRNYATLPRRYEEIELLGLDLIRCVFRCLSKRNSTGDGSNKRLHQDTRVTRQRGAGRTQGSVEYRGSRS